MKSEILTKTKCIITFVVFQITSIFIIHAQNTSFKVIVEGNVYDSLLFTGYDIHENRFVISGIKESMYGWEFIVPDSLGALFTSFRLSTKLYDEANNTLGNIAFVCNENPDLNKKISHLYWDQESLTIKAHFVTQVEKEDFFGVKKGEEVVYLQGKIIEDIFAIECSSHKQFMLPVEYTDFSLRNLDDKQYKEVINRFSDYIKLYPNSKYLITLLKMRFTHFNSVEEIEPLYNLFSQNIKKSFWGSEIYRRIHTKHFENTSLPLWNDTVEENIVKDFSKYNLVIFSASWCRPCLEKLPILRRLYEDLNKNIEFTFVSIDDHKSIENWKKLMIDEKIPWRSLVASNNLKYIMTKYFLAGVPHYILVWPDETMEEIDIDKEIEIEKLYNLIL